MARRDPLLSGWGKWFWAWWDKVELLELNSEHYSVQNQVSFIPIVKYGGGSIMICGASQCSGWMLLNTERTLKKTCTRLHAILDLNKGSSFSLCLRGSADPKCCICPAYQGLSKENIVFCIIFCMRNCCVSLWIGFAICIPWCLALCLLGLLYRCISVYVL